MSWHFNTPKRRRTPLKRFDGARRTVEDWVLTGQDQELWTRNGNCYIYLAEQSQTKVAPSFRIPISALLDRRCQPLLNHIIDFDSYGPQSIAAWSHMGHQPTFNLYLPPKSHASQREVQQHYLSIRNFLAWVVGRSLVGESLGAALIGLVESMQIYRTAGNDNASDLLYYMDEEGYWYFDEQPTHAIAALQLAEKFGWEDLYTRAFAHCVGMGNLATSDPDYRDISARSRQLMRAANHDMLDRIEHCSDMLSTFLDSDLSDVQIGLTPESRVYLYQFRSFLRTFYAAKFGQYPPPMFDACMLREMYDDFAALYSLLVDDGPASFGSAFPMQAGGVYALQSLQVFDSQHGLEPLQHQSPLLPQIDHSQVPRRQLWPGSRRRSIATAASHTALMNASNWQSQPTDNDLVRAYRSFEGLGVERQEFPSLVDARKARWVLVYATYQILRRATARPAQAENDDTRYHLNVSQDGLPPWNQPLPDHGLRPETADTMTTVSTARPQSGAPFDMASPCSVSDNDTVPVQVPVPMAIEPDIDYFALSPAEPTPVAIRRRSTSSMLTNNMLTRSVSGLKRDGSHRKPQRSNTSLPKDSPPVPTPSPSWVRRFSTIAITESASPPESDTATSSESGSSSGCVSERSSQRKSTTGSITSVDTSVDTTAAMSPAVSDHCSDWDDVPTSLPRNLSRRSLTSVMGSISRRGSLTARRPSTQDLSHGGTELAYTSLTRSLSMRLPEFKRWTREFPEGALSQAHQVRKVGIAEADDDLDDWNDMEAFLDGTKTAVSSPNKETMPAWEQYNDLGGLAKVC